MLELDTESLVSDYSISLYIDYPDALSPETDKTINVVEANEVVKQVIEAVTALLTESHLASIPIFSDRLRELVEGVTRTTIENEHFKLDISKVGDILTSFASFLGDTIGPIVQGYIPPLPELFVTTLIDVTCRCDCVIVTIHY